MIATLDYPKKITVQQFACQIETVINDLARLSDVVTQLSDLPYETLKELDLSSELEAVHRCLTRFANYCASMSTYSDATLDAEATANIAPSRKIRDTNQQWGTLRRNTKRANQLAGQLTLTLRELRTQESELPHQSSAPEDVQRMNLSVVTTVNRLLAEWNHPLE